VRISVVGPRKQGPRTDEPPPIADTIAAAQRTEEERERRPRSSETSRPSVSLLAAPLSRALLRRSYAISMHELGF
jgi:hypothetical protein